MPTITKDISVAEIVKICPSARRIFDAHGLKGCGGEHGPAESLAFFAAVHQVDVEVLVRELKAELQKPSLEEYTYRETLGDYIYRRFFKAGIAVMLTVGGLWGAINLAQIALGKNFLQLRLVPAIHAHAHAMIFGWVGLFVMGFAYQSFPRFKYTTLWRPDLANLSFYLMLVGIVSRMGAEMFQNGPLALGLGAFASVAELVAIGLFLTILFQTTRHSLGPHSPYEKFIGGAMVWFFLQALLSDFFFFAKATAANSEELIRRIALIDGPLRDVQLLGFAAFIIVGVSQRFVPVVYGLGQPKRDRQNLLFALMNVSLLLDVACYVFLLTTRNLIFAVGLELSYLLMLVWALLAVRQLRIFATPADRDRSWKFIRAAYVWLLVSQTMLPFLIIYGALLHQGFSHTFAGAYRHAYTVGFVSLMILGVSSRVVPILAGVDSKQTSSLWGPFVLLNQGCIGRVALQILTDFWPAMAYPLVGLTGFLEVAALAWWGIELWHTMNLTKAGRAKLLMPPIPLAAR